MYSNIFKILKYIVYGTIVYLLFCYVPSNELSVNDITIITSIVLMTFIIMDYISPSESKCSTENFRENFDEDINDSILDDDDDFNRAGDDINNSILDDDVTDDNNEEESINNNDTNNEQVEVENQKNALIKDLINNQLVQKDNEISDLNFKVDDLVNKSAETENVKLQLSALQEKVNKMELEKEELMNQIKLDKGNDEYSVSNTKYAVIDDLVGKGVLSKEITNAIKMNCNNNSPKCFCTAVIEKLENNNKIPENEAKKLLNTFKNIGTECSLLDQVLANLIIDGVITDDQARSILSACSNNAKQCKDFLGKLLDDGIINKTQAKRILSAAGFSDKVMPKDLGLVKEEVNSLKEVPNDDEMNYTQLLKEQHESLGLGTGKKWEYGYSYLNNDKWSIPEKRVPVCKTEKRCPVCPTTGFPNNHKHFNLNTVDSNSTYPISLEDFNTSREIKQPDNISIKYTKEKLNKNSF
jgi:hypothetical protein